MRTVMFGIAMLAFTAQQAHAAPAVAITEERNVAVGFSATQQMVVFDSLINQCSAFKSTAEATSQAYTRWTERNALAVRATWAYMVLVQDAIRAQQGEDAAKDFDADRKAEFTAATRQALLAIFKDGIVDAASCVNLASLVERGAMDITRVPENYEVLEQIDSEIQELPVQ